MSKGKVIAASETTGGMWLRFSFTIVTMRVMQSSRADCRVNFWAARAAKDNNGERSAGK